MSVRTFIYGKLVNTPAITALVLDRVFAKKSMTSSVEDHPYIVYKLGYNANERLSETKQISRQFLQIFVHDYADGDIGDYTRIDQVLQAIKDTLVNQQSPEDKVINIAYVETSQDLDDNTLKTVMKYSRYLIMVEE